MLSINDKKKIKGNVLRRKTLQRERVFQSIACGKHLSARTIFEIVSHYCQMSFGTVYRNLQILVEEGLVNEIDINTSHTYYERKSEPHYHLRCTKCGDIFDIPLPYRHSLNSDAQQDGFKIFSHTIIFEGICPECSGKFSV